jgi:hypothetical protein
LLYTIVSAATSAFSSFSIIAWFDGAATFASLSPQN